MSISQAVILVYFNPKNKDEVLCVSRKEDHNSYGLPGGKIESEETYLSALVRELEEEINISVNPHKCSFGFQAICCDSDTITYITDDVLEIPTTPFINDEGAMVSFQPIAKLINENDSLFYEYNLKLFKSLNNDLDYIQYQK